MAVFLQGGPSASISILLGGNTAPRSLDPVHNGGERVAPNPHSWSSFANLLYVESPVTGFSYVPPGQTVRSNERPFALDVDADAANFIRVLLRFLHRHPRLTDNPVILVGESYGGVRATLMLDKILDIEGLEDPASFYVDPMLAQELREHYLRAFPALGNETPSRADMARQFGHQVLIQPALLGTAQENLTKVLNETDPRRGSPDRDGVLEAFAESLLDPQAHAAFMGLDVSTIAWHHADARGGGATCLDFHGLDDSEWAKVFGELRASESFFTGYCLPPDTWIGRPRGWGDAPDSLIAHTFFRNSRHLLTFITDAAHDPAARGDALVAAFKVAPKVTSVSIEDAPDSERYLVVRRETGDVHRIRYPFYADSGHSVSLHQPKEVLRDVRRWYEDAITDAE